MVERLVRNEKVWGSNPHTSTNSAKRNVVTREGMRTSVRLPARKRHREAERSAAKLAELRPEGEIIPIPPPIPRSGIKWPLEGMRTSVRLPARERHRGAERQRSETGRARPEGEIIPIPPPIPRSGM